MAISTYSELQTAVSNWLDRSDLTARIPEFIALAEARFNRILRTPDMVTRNDSFTVDSQYETVPTGHLETVRIVLSTTPVTTLIYLTPEEMAEKREALSSSACPAYFSVQGGSYEFLPSPDASYTASVVYYVATDGLATTDPNWLLTSHPDIYLYGALVAAEPYLKNDERVAVWKGLLDQSIAELNALADRKLFATTPRAMARAF